MLFTSLGRATTAHNFFIVLFGFSEVFRLAGFDRFLVMAIMIVFFEQSFDERILRKNSRCVQCTDDGFLVNPR
jgi:hypothetical protein